MFSPIKEVVAAAAVTDDKADEITNNVTTFCLINIMFHVLCSDV